MKQYLVYHEECYEDGGLGFKNKLVIVNAKSEKEAKKMFAYYYAQNDLEGESENLLTEDEVNCKELYDENFEISPQFKGNIDEYHENKVRKYFEGTNFADIFLEFYQNYTDGDTLPVELLVYHLLKRDEEEEFIIVKPIEDFLLQ